MEQQQHLFTNKMLRALLVPIIMEQLLNALMGTVDTMMVSNVGSAAISAVSLVDSINVLIIQAFSALAAGGTIICTQYLGQKNHEMANKSARQALFIITAISVCIVTLGLIFRAPLLSFIFGKVDADVMDNSMVYFFYTVLSYPFIALYDAGASIFRAQENTRGPMVISIISNVMNIGGNAVLIWVFHMGVAGAAISTLVSTNLLCSGSSVSAAKRQTAHCGEGLSEYPPGWKYDKADPGTWSALWCGEQYVSAWKAGNPVHCVYPWNHSHCSSGYDQYYGDAERNGCNRRGNRTDDRSRPEPWRRTQGRSCVLYEKADDLFRGLSDCLLCDCVCTGETDHHDRRHGAGKCQNVPEYDILDHHCKASGMDAGLYSSLRHACSRRCEIFHDHLLHHHVGIPFLSLRLPDPRLRHGPHGRLDRNVHRLDRKRNCIQSSL